VAGAARQGLDARWAAVWILSPDGTRADLAAVAGAITTLPAMVAQLFAAGEPIGRLACGPRRRGSHTAEDQQLLGTLGRQAALGLSHARLAEQLQARLEQLDGQAHELAASRARLVAAEAAGRRRLERDIHDGVQQQLVSLMTKLTVARAQLSAGSDTVGSTLDTMQQEFRELVADLRDLTSGIHPAVLTDQGLTAAVVALAARLPLPVTIDGPSGTAPRLDQHAEAAAYFGIAEALTNVLKHAGARQAWVRLGHADGRFSVEVGDDGQGFDTVATRERGLSGLRDRVEALDGTLAVRSAPGGPTTIRMTLPTPAAGP
jgi:signal transduction histidine kinase